MQAKKGEKAGNNESDASSQKSRDLEAEKPFTVPYLNPLVLRKEVESVIEQEGDLCSVKQDFAKDHPIIYWNLIWFFERINLPSHLPALAFSSSSLQVRCVHFRQLNKCCPF